MLTDWLTDLLTEIFFWILYGRSAQLLYVLTPIPTPSFGSKVGSCVLQMNTTDILLRTETQPIKSQRYVENYPLLDFHTSHLNHTILKFHKFQKVLHHALLMDFLNFLKIFKYCFQNVEGSQVQSVYIYNCNRRF